MACFLVSAAEAVVTTIAVKVIEKKENANNKNVNNELKADLEHVEIAAEKIPFSKKVKWLRSMLWGGTALLAFEHVWNGEVVPYFPFLTAASNPEDAVEMLKEMATVGVSMAVLVTVVWLGIIGVVALLEKKNAKPISMQQ